MNRAIKYRVYPDIEQELLFSKTFGCCRKVWNLMLESREEAFRKDGTQLRPTPAMYKKEYPYLKEVDSLALANVQLDLQDAYRRYFTVKGSGKPRFKSKKNGRQSYTTNNQHGTVALDAEKGFIRLPKSGMLRARIHRLPEEGWLLKSATVSRDPDGKYYCSLLFEYEKEISPVLHPQQNALGLDYKSDGLYADSEGNVCGSPKYYRKGQKRLARAQRRLRHKQKGSRNFEKACLKIAREHSKISNRRKDHLHKQSLAIAKQYDMVCVEDLDMKALANRGFGNGKATLDNGYGMFLSMLEYKLNDRGKVLVRIDKWYPSSRICSECGSIHPLPLYERTFRCPDCGLIMDRDLNAAVNIKREGIRVFLNG